MLGLVVYLTVASTRSKVLKLSLCAAFALIIIIYSVLLTPFGVSLYSKISTVQNWTHPGPMEKPLSPQDLELLKSVLGQNWKYAFIYFGYTFCPDVCPTTLTILSKLYKKNEDNIKTIPALFITIDPERDTEERLKEYTSFFLKELESLRLHPIQLEKLMGQFGAKYKINDKPRSGHYTVDHSAYVYLVNNHGDLIQTFSHPLKADEVKTKIKELKLTSKEH